MELTVIGNWYIFAVNQLGNIGPHEFRISKMNPAEGFYNEEEAERHLFDTLKTSEYNKFSRYTIMKLYHQIKVEENEMEA